MYEATLDELKQLLKDNCKAWQYALDHYEEVVSRTHSYTLYGPHAHWLGASIPCNTVTPKRARKLMAKTRRKDYVIYHLDEHYKVMRTIIVLEYTRVDVIYHHFELDGVVYAFSTPGSLKDGEVQPFSSRFGKRFYVDGETHFLRFEDEKPVSYGIVNPGLVFVQFYEYVDSQRMVVTTYRYWPFARRNEYGDPIDPDAPIGADNSPVRFKVYEVTPEDTDFSRWFK